MLTPPKLYMLDRSLRRLGPVPRYSSYVYRRSYASIGEAWTLTVPFAPGDDLSLFAPGNFLYDPDPRRPRGGIVTGLTLTEGEQDEVTVTGYPCDWLVSLRLNLRPGDDALARRNYGYDPVPYAGAGGAVGRVPAETALKAYAARHMTAPEDAKRRIPYLSIAPDRGRGKALAYLAENGDRLQDTLENLCIASGLGYEIALAEGGMTFDIVEGRDLTRSGRRARAVVFSVSRANVSTLSYETGNGDYKNCAYALGEELEGGLRAMLAVTQEEAVPAGTGRIETLVDCGSLSAVETDTALSMQAKAVQELRKTAQIETVTAEAVSTERFAYLDDWDLGDVVSVDIPKYGITADMRITGVEERYEPDDLRVVPILGETVDSRKRLLRTIKTISR
jgi:hypothetical protein